MGVDIGQKRDPTAIAVTEIQYRPSEEKERPREESHYLVRYLDRLPLGTPYPEVARRLKELCGRVKARSGLRPEVFVDATGVGKPVVDLLEASAPQARCVWAVYLTSGHRRTEDRAERKVSLGKARLARRLQALVQGDRLHLPRGRESGALFQELLDYESRVGRNGRDRYGAFRSGAHDDLLTALALAVHQEPTTLPVTRQAGWSESHHG